MSLQSPGYIKTTEGEVLASAEQLVMFEIVATSVSCLSLRIISLFFSTFLRLLTLDFNGCTAFTTFF